MSESGRLRHGAGGHPRDDPPRQRANAAYAPTCSPIRTFTPFRLATRNYQQGESPESGRVRGTLRSIRGGRTMVIGEEAGGGGPLGDALVPGAGARRACTRWKERNNEGSSTRPVEKRLARALTLAAEVDASLLCAA